MSDVLRTLWDRGFIEHISDKVGLQRAVERGPITLYWGTDPTADSLTAGHLVSLMLLMHFARDGHNPIVVVGGGTGLIGDPTGKTEMRQMLTVEQIDRNIEGQRTQISKFLDAPVLNNADWLAPLHYLEFLRDVGKHFTVNRLLQHETYRERLRGEALINVLFHKGVSPEDLTDTAIESEGLNFVEFNYALLQAYDFLHLFRQRGCVLQVGGADQWFNILAGADLIRRAEGGVAYGLVTPLLTTATGEKMGKTARGAVWLDAARTSSYDFYQYWINVYDEDLKSHLRLLTFLPLAEIDELLKVGGADLRRAKELLAFEVTKIVHGEGAALEAQKTSQALFGMKDWVSLSLSGDDTRLDIEGAPTTEVEWQRLTKGVRLADLLVETGLAASKRAARDLIRQGGTYINGSRVADDTAVISDTDLMSEGVLLIRVGKKRYHRVVPSRSEGA